jgi:NH3-dependent NAD+ synthetase
VSRRAEPEQQAWITGVRDYIGKNGFPGVVIGLSGGIDPHWCWRSRLTPWG